MSYLIRDEKDFVKAMLEIDSESHTSMAWRDDHFRRVCADWREYQEELEGLDFSEDDCAGCKL